MMGKKYHKKKRKANKEKKYDGAVYNLILCVVLNNVISI